MDWITDDYPDWPDVGNRVEVELEDGRIVVGDLEADDWYDVPIFEGGGDLLTPNTEISGRSSAGLPG